jgi:hypothetical protein
MDVVKRHGMESKELWIKFCLLITILKRPRDKIVRRVIDLNNALILIMNFEAILRWSKMKEVIKMGINRVERAAGFLKGGAITIHLEIYGTVIDVNLEGKKVQR